LKEKILSYLSTYKKATVALAELEKLVSGLEASYEDFAEAILSLENDGILSMVKSRGRNHKKVSLAYSYRINKAKLREKYHNKLQYFQLQFHPQIRLDDYYSLPEAEWENDFPYIQKVDQYLKNKGLPQDTVPAPERSYELVGDEKWITEQGGKEILERIKLWEKMLVIPFADPLMMAFNPGMLNYNEHYHLIVENKTTYQALVQTLPETCFTTLIYGGGKKIIASIDHFNSQLLLKDSAHHFYYFGDLDYEGITIWYLLNKKIPAKPYLLLYRALLKKAYTTGKQNQSRNEEALSSFYEYFTSTEREYLEEMFQLGGYYPQEALKTAELRNLWRSAQCSNTDRMK